MLTEADLFDGSRNRAVTTLPNLPEPEPAPEPEPDIVEVKEVAGERPEAAEVEEAARDDLKEIKGVGPVNEAQLNELGIYTFAQVAAWTPANVDWVEDFLSFPGRIEREDWIAQAKALAERKSGGDA